MQGSDVTPPNSTIAEEEFASIVRRAALLGIPAWRIRAALGQPLPRTDGG